MPVESFSRKSAESTKLSANLWVATAKTEATKNRAVLLLQPDQALAAELNNAGFDVLALSLRKEARAKLKPLVEDVQSGVIFLKTDPRVRADRVSIVGEGEGAKGAVHYAGATKQMALIVDALALLTADKNVPLDQVVEIPTRIFSSRTMKKNILEFLLKPKHGRHS